MTSNKKEVKWSRIVLSILLFGLYLLIQISSYLDKGEFCMGTVKRAYANESICTNGDPVPFLILSFMWIGFCVYLFLAGLNIEVFHKNEDDDYWNKGKSEKNNKSQK